MTDSPPSGHGCVKSVVQLCLFGLGRIGQRHYRNIQQNADAVVVVVVEANYDHARVWIEKNDPASQVNVIPYADVQSVLCDKSIDGIIVATATNTHEEIVMSALKHGKAVYCEKPLTLLADVAKRCYNMAESTGVPLVCGFNRRFDPSFSSLYKRVHGGEVGDLKSLRLVSRDPVPPPTDYFKEGIHMFLDCTIHIIDLACWIAGSYPISVYVAATATSPESIEFDDVDTAVVLLTFPNNVIVTLENCRSTMFGHDNRIEAFGSKGMLVADNHHYTTIDLYNERGKTADKIYYFMDRFTDSYVAAMDHFIQVLRGETTCIITSSDVINGLRVADACRRSYKTGEVISMTYSD